MEFGGNKGATTNVAIPPTIYRAPMPGFPKTAAETAGETRGAGRSAGGTAAETVGGSALALQTGDTALFPAVSPGTPPSTPSFPGSFRSNLRSRFGESRLGAL